jgi:hypothetical protein
LNEIKGILEEMGLSLGMKLDNFPLLKKPDQAGNQGKEEGLNQ